MVHAFSKAAQRVFAATAIICVSMAYAFPSYASLGGMSERQLDDVLPRLQAKVPGQPPGPLEFSGTKLVDVPSKPWIAPRKSDLRGPCPGLNTLANHGYLPRDGVATPAQIIIASQEGFNMNNKLARFTTYAAHLVDGNLVTDLISIGDKSRKTGPTLPPPAIVGGLNNHGTFEGDVSLTRGDAFFGDNHSFNATLFDQLKDFSNRYGGGFYNYTVASELRWHRIQQSIATNPQFKMIGLRHITAYAEATFPANFFVDGRTTGSKAHHLDMKDAETFFKTNRYPRGFFRSAQPSGSEGAEIVYGLHPTLPGRNDGAVNTFVNDLSLGGIVDGCKFYTEFVNTTVRALYPSPTGVLRRNLKTNLGFLFDALVFGDCDQVFPYGQ